MTVSASHANRLAQETSPYLLQHAANPVDWYPWGREALEHARQSRRPILLSIGYSACHWCHVMAHESFEDPATAAVMNELFVNIKVDREERPDLDRIYQLAHQVITQRRGGWPLTMFLTPDDCQPFFGGTYFPPTARFGLPGFPDLLLRVAAYHREHGLEIARQNAQLARLFTDLDGTHGDNGGAGAPADAGNPALPDRTPLAAARQELALAFDREYGGFGEAPKFPHASYIEFLLRAWRGSAASDQPDLHALFMATLTLTRMADGGLADQLGGGFCRYSVDRFWMIPHFEKMLYDNAQLLRVYALATAATGDPLYRRTALATAAWAIRDLQSPLGGFWSTLDADSEGHEGRFYVWTPEAVRAVLEGALGADAAAAYAAFVSRYGLDRGPNFEGAWHLHGFRGIDDVAADLSLPVAEVEALIDRARQALLEARNTRIWPGRDDKILTAWNGLMVSGLATAARCLGQPDLAVAATRAVDFLAGHCWRADRLLAVHAGGEARFPAYLDDYAFLLAGLLDLLETRWRTADLEFAIRLAEALLSRFPAPGGGFYFTAADHEQLIHRPRSFADEALPAGNAAAALALGRLGWLVGEPRYLDAAERTVHAARAGLAQHPSAHSTLLLALDELLDPPDLVILRGDAPTLAAWQADLARIYAPARVVFGIPADATGLPPALAAKAPPATGPGPGPDPVAYVCRGPVCSAPVRSLSALVELTRR